MRRRFSGLWRFFLPTLRNAKILCAKSSFLLPIILFTGIAYKKLFCESLCGIMNKNKLYHLRQRGMYMNEKSQKIYQRGNRNIYINILPGHFATNHSHVNFYVDMTSLKTRYSLAKLAAEALAAKIGTSIAVDTIICLEGTEMIGAFVAQELSKSSLMAMNSGVEINVLSPELNVNNQMIFQHNTQELVAGKCILLLISSVTTGKTIQRAIDCLQYYQGHLTDIGAIFSAERAIGDVNIHAIFTEADLPQYETYTPGNCLMCQEKRKINAIVNNAGYTPI